MNYVEQANVTPLSQSVPILEAQSSEDDLEFMPDLPACLVLVKQIASSLCRRGVKVPMDDLLSAGNEGLAMALKSYDPKGSANFKTFARYRIRGAMLDHLRLLDPGSRSLRPQQRDLERARTALARRLGREPESDELARELAIELDELYSLRAAIHWSTYADPTLRDTKDWPYQDPLDLVPSPGEDPFTLCFKAERREQLTAAIEELPERLRLVVALKYHEELTSREIASVLGVTESRVSQMLSEAISRLKKRCR